MDGDADGVRIADAEADTESDGNADGVGVVSLDAEDVT